MSKYAGIEIQCERCRGVFYRLTELFSPTPPMRGDYVELLPKYGVGGYNWYDFPHTQWTIGDNVACVQCGEPIRMEHVKKAVNEQAQKADEEKTQKTADAAGSLHGLSASGAVSSDNDEPSNFCGCSHNGGCGGPDCSCVHGGRSDAPVPAVDSGIYDNVDLEDSLMTDVLRMTSGGMTQAEIAKTCGISVYRVRKMQSGDLS